MDTKASNNTPTRHFMASDGLRGVLALLVAIYHVAWINLPNAYFLTERASVILDLFFVFSGFLIFTLYSEKLADRAYPIGKFMVRRFARLYPLHFVTLMVFVLWTVFRGWLHMAGFADGDTPVLFEAGTPESLRNFVANLTFLNAVGITDGLGFNAPSWTIGAEFLSYGVFAVAMWIFGRRLWSAAGLVCVAVFVGMLYAYLSVSFSTMNISYDGGFIRCLAGFFLGVIVSAAHQRGIFSINRFASLIEIWTVAIFILFIVVASDKQQFMVAPFLFLFVIVFIQDKGILSRLLATRPLLYLGALSYSIYLNHMIIAIGVDMVFRHSTSFIAPGLYESMWAGTLVLIGYLAVVVAISALTVKFIEAPARRWILARFDIWQPNRRRFGRQKLVD